MLRKISTGIVIIALAFLTGLMSLSSGVHAQEAIASIETQSRLFDVAWSPDGQLLAVAGDVGIEIYDNTLTKIASLQDHSDIVITVAWNPDNTLLASASVDNTIKIWHRAVATNTFTLVTTLPGSLDQEYALAWSPNGLYLASMGLDFPERGSNLQVIIGEVVIRDVETWEIMTVLADQLLYPNKSLAWSPDSTKLAGVGNIWCVDCPTSTGPGFYVADVFTGERLYYDSRPENPYVLDWSINDRIATSLSGIDVFDAISGEHLYFLDVPSYLIQWSPDGNKIALTGDVLILDATTGAILRRFITADSPSALDWRPDGERIGTVTKSGIIEIWDSSNLLDVSGTPTITPYPTYIPTSTPVAGK